MLSPILTVLVTFCISSAVSYNRVCYYTNWSQYRNGAGKFYPENVDPSLCTHVIYAFAKLNGNHLKAFEWNDESTPWMKGMYERFQKLKQQNPSLKTSLAVGGWNMGSAPFTRMVATDASRRDFATDTVKFLRKHGFDGLDLDWEYPANRGSPASDRDKYTELIKVLHAEFEKEAQATGNDRLILTAAVPAGKSNIDPGYDIPEISKYLDMFNLMTYDLHGGGWEDKTGHNAPLYQSPKDTGNNTMLNVKWAAEYWVQKGAPKSKMNIGMPLYGRSFTLADPNNNGLYAPDRGNGGQAGRYTGEAGFLSYYEICEMLKTGGVRHYLPTAEVPYLVKGSQWVGYDDPESLRKKVDFVKAGGYGGIMVWALDLDDFSGSCGQGKYPLMHAINDELGSSAPVTSAPTKASPMTTRQPQSTPPLVVTQKTTQPPQPGQTNPTMTTVVSNPHAAASYNRVCYHTNWSQYRNGKGKFYPENVDPSLCTHVIYAFAKLNGNHIKAFEWNDESTPWMKGMYERFQKLKQQNPSLKTSLAVGGWNMGSAPFTRMVATDASRRDFATDAVKFLRKHGFDGLDLDWEYPANRGSPASDRDKFTELVKVLRAEFEKEAQATGNERLILSAAVPAGKGNIDTGYNIPEVSKYVDMYNLMTYDMHGGSWEDKVGHNAPLYQSPKDTGNNTILNVKWAAEYWVQKGAPKSKINIGMPLYGRSFTLADPNNNGLYAPDRGNGGQAGRFTNEAGFLAYYEICEMLKTGGVRHYLPAAEVPYLVKGSQWVGYDDPDSLRKKVDFVKAGGYGGIMVWALDLDDFGGTCGQGKYPLLHAINDELGSSKAVTTVPTNVPTMTTRQPQSSSLQVVTQKTTQAPKPVQTNPTMPPNPVQTNPTMSSSPVQTNPTMPSSPVQTNPTQAPSLVQTNPTMSSSPIQTNPTQAPSPVQTNPTMSSSPFQTNPTKAPSPVQTSPKMSSSPIQTNPTKAPSPVRTSPTMSSSPVQTKLTQAPSPVQTNPTMSSSSLQTNPTRAPSPVKTSPTMSSSPLQTNPTKAPSTVKTNPTMPTSTVKTNPTMPSSTVKTNPTMPTSTVKTNPTMPTSTVQTNPTISSSPVQTIPTMTPVVTNPPAVQTTQHHVGQTQKFSCQNKASGFYADPNSCSSYYICAGGQGFEVTCASGLNFNPKTKYCDWPNNAVCVNKPTNPPAHPTNPPQQTMQPQQTTTRIVYTPQPTIKQTTTAGNDPAAFCHGKGEGTYRDPEHCGMFYQCASGLAFHEHCPTGTAYNDVISNCDYPNHVAGCQGFYGK